MAAACRVPEARPAAVAAGAAIEGIAAVAARETGVAANGATAVTGATVASGELGVERTTSLLARFRRSQSVLLIFESTAADNSAVEMPRRVMACSMAGTLFWLAANTA